MIDKNTTHLAGEFLVAGELSRRGYPVAITFGNAKSVDIYATTQQGEIKLMQKPGEQKVISPYQKVRLMKKHITYLFICKVKRKYLQIYHQSISLQLAMKF